MPSESQPSALNEALEAVSEQFYVRVRAEPSQAKPSQSEDTVQSIAFRPAHQAVWLDYLFSFAVFSVSSGWTQILFNMFLFSRCLIRIHRFLVSFVRVLVLCIVYIAVTAGLIESQQFTDELEPVSSRLGADMLSPCVLSMKGASRKKSAPTFLAVLFAVGFFCSNKCLIFHTCLIFVSAEAVQQTTVGVDVFDYVF